MQIIPVVIIVIVLGLGAYWLVNRAAAQEQGLKASGTIEATDVTISPEIGGRVLDVTVSESTLGAALERVYRAASRIRFKGMHYRRDIGHRALGNGEH